MACRTKRLTARNSYFISIGMFGKILKLIKEKKCKRVLFAGKIDKPKISNLKFDLKGVYFYLLGDEIKYVGRCKDSMKQRVNSGYGKISPKNCFKDGQSTNCKVNACILIFKKDIELKILVLENDKEIEKIEIEMIEKFNPTWNKTK